MTRLHHVNVVVAPGGAAALVGFYELLGLQSVPKPAQGVTAGGAWFDIGGGAQLHLSERADVEPGRRAGHTDQHFGLVVDDFDAVLARLAAAGAPWTEQADLFGGRRGFTRDPAGNRVELLEAAGSLA